jgi:hypothetical protein
MAMFARTGRMVSLSAPWLTVMPATGLAEHDPPPEVTGQLGELFRERHRLIEVGKEITEQGSEVHCALACSLAGAPAHDAARLYHGSPGASLLTCMVNKHLKRSLIGRLFVL